MDKAKRNEEVDFIKGMLILGITYGHVFKALRGLDSITPTRIGISMLGEMISSMKIRE